MLKSIIRIQGLESVKYMVKLCATSVIYDGSKNRSMHMIPFICCDCDAKGKLVVSNTLSHCSKLMGLIGGSHNSSCITTQKVTI